jgi:DNA-binding PadR family transcriptional regulator
MPDPEALDLSLSEWLVLCVVCEKPVHGWAIVALLGPEGSLGAIWQVPKPTVYRALPRLEALGLVRTAGEEPSSQGPVRSVIQVTSAGRQAARRWLATPVAHPRDVRSELLMKLALLDRAGADPGALLLAQQLRLAPIAAALGERLADAEGFERTLILCRHEAMTATMRFLAELTAQVPAPAAPASG